MNNIKLKFKVGSGGAVFEYKKDGATLDEAVEILKDENVISVSVVKQTPTQYLKGRRPINGEEAGTCNTSQSRRTSAKRAGAY